MRLLHISADFPDPLAPAKTRAVETLIGLTPEREHHVYSLNRVSGLGGIEALTFGPDWRALVYGAPPKGFLLARSQRALAAYIAEDVARRGLSPDLVHGHKLSVEGPVVESVADALGVPFVVTSMGDSDLKIIKAKPGMRPTWQRVWRRAARVIVHAPWTRARLEALLGPRDGPVAVVPVPTGQDAIRRPRIVGPLFRSVFHLASWRRKNGLGLIEAAAKARCAVPELRLEIAGGGDAAGFARLRRATGDGPCRLIGPVRHGEMGDFLNGSGGFALPSHRETYGMVYAEALLAGVPVLHGAGNGIDGLLTAGEVTVAPPSGDTAAIAEGLVWLAREEAAIKTRLAALQENGGLDHLRREAIAAAYRAVLDSAAPQAG
jgi:glycosyltransferase involved in cell wall biosynthesis